MYTDNIDGVFREANEDGNPKAQAGTERAPGQGGEQGKVHDHPHANGVGEVARDGGAPEDLTIGTNRADCAGGSSSSGREPATGGIAARLITVLNDRHALLTERRAQLQTQLNGINAELAAVEHDLRQAVEIREATANHTEEPGE